MEPRKQAICDALARWIKQRPGLEYGNYGDPTSYRAECRSIARDKREAETLLAAVRWRDSITADDLLKAAQGAFSGRLTISLEERQAESDYTSTGGNYFQQPPGKEWRAKIDYCAGQYWPTEYRKAVCAVLASALWDYTREKAMPPPKGYRVESWAQLGAVRRLHTVRDTLAEAAEELEKLGGSDYGSVNAVYLTDMFQSAGDWLRAHFTREFGRGIASRWFR